MIAIYNTEGDLQCKYNYDAWGNHRVGNARDELIYDSATGVIALGYENHIAILNPIRYRGYYYDTETGLYYLQSRYYDATLCRFLNRDNVNYLEPESIHGLNLYAYCNNNPVMFADPSGHFAISTTILLFLIGLGSVIGFSTVLYTDYNDDGEVFNGSKSWSLYLLGTIIGGAIGTVIGYFAAPAIAGLLTSSSSIGCGFALAGGLGATGGVLAVSTIGEIALVGAAALTGIGALGITYLFSKGFGPRMGHNQHEKQMWDEAMKRLDIKDKDLMRRLHNEIHKYPYADDLKKLIEVLKRILKKWGKYNE